MSRASAGKERDLCAAPAPAIDLLADLTFLPCFLSFAKNICSPKSPFLPLAVFSQGGSLALRALSSHTDPQLPKLLKWGFCIFFFFLSFKL